MGYTKFEVQSMIRIMLSEHHPRAYLHCTHSGAWAVSWLLGYGPVALGGYIGLNRTTAWAGQHDTPEQVVSGTRAHGRCRLVQTKQCMSGAGKGSIRLLHVTLASRSDV